MKTSWEGYLVGLRFRSRLSLLVEGKDDRVVMAQLVRHGSASTSADKEIVIDEVGSLGGFQNVPGMRDRVEHVAVQAAGDAQIVSGDKFRASVDRDFRDFCTKPPLQDQNPSCRVYALVHWTRGHSIENYFLSEAAVCECINTLYCEHVNQTALDSLRVQFKSLLIESTCLSLACMHGQLLERAETAFDHSVWKLDASLGTYRLDCDQILAQLTKRGTTPASANEMWADYKVISSDATRVGEEVRWFGHGKMTLRLLWAGVAAVLREHGVPAELLRRIGCGDRDNKFRVAAKWWVSRSSSGTGEFPCALLHWFGGARLAVDSK